MGTSSSKPIMGIGSGGGDINTDLGNLMMNMNSSSNVNPYMPSNQGGAGRNSNPKLPSSHGRKFAGAAKGILGGTIKNKVGADASYYNPSAF